MPKRRAATQPKPTPEQQLAIRAEAPYVLVSASAGTGKTRTLIDRVMRVLRDGVPLDRLLVVTFTVKAAGELLERLRDGLGRDPKMRAQRLLLPQAHVSTIHGFCARWLREYAVEARVEPGFRTLAEPEDALSIATILDNLFHHWYRGSESGADVPRRDSRPHREFLRLVELCGIRNGREQLRGELEQMLHFTRVHADPEGFLRELEDGLRGDRLPFAASYARMLLENWTSGIAFYAHLVECALGGEGSGNFAPHAALLETLTRAPSPWGPFEPERPENEERIRMLGEDLPARLGALRDYLSDAGALNPKAIRKIGFPRMPPRNPRLKPFNNLAKKLLNDDRSPLHWAPQNRDAIAEHYRASRATLEVFLTLLRQLMGRYEAYKEERGLLDFADLELRTRALLRDPPPGLTERFEMVLVDEFQDVNPLQAEIVARLSPARGRFLVGDVKQCIYQFRLSDPAIFRDMASGAITISPEDAAEARDAERVRIFLSRNFRSRYPVLQLVNSLFATLFSPEMIGGDYMDEALRFQAASAKAPRVLCDPPLLGSPGGASPADPVPGWAPAELHVFDKPERSPEQVIDAVIAAEARFVAARLRELHAERFPISDGHGGFRSMRFSDIAIILRSPRTTGALFARILRAAGIPAAFGAQDFFAREETRDFLNLVRVLDNAHDDIALAAVLRSPAADFGDEDLACVRLAWPQSLSLLAALRASATRTASEWSGPLAGADPLSDRLSHRCEQFVDRLARWRERAASSDLPSALAAVLDESGLLEAAAASEDGQSRIGHLEQLLALARRYAADRDHALPGFMHHLESLEASGRGLETLARGAQEAVQILSLHKAKGLEFPVVVHALLGRTFNDQDARGHLLTGEGWIGVDLFDPHTYVKTPTLAHRTQSELRRRKTREEEMRILYVALTRARDKLILTGTLSKKWDRLEEQLHVWRALDRVPTTVLWQPNNSLDWLLCALARRGGLPPEFAPGEAVSTDPGLLVQRHAAVPPAELAAAGDAGGDAEPAGEEGVPSSEALDALAARLKRRYAHEAAKEWRGKYWVTEIKRLVDEALHAEEREEGSAPLPAAPRREPPAPGEWNPLEEGSWFHAVLEAADPSQTDTQGLQDAARGLANRGQIPPDWISPERLDPIARFFASPLGAKLRAAGDTLEREVNFSLRLSPTQLARVWPQASALGEDEWILVQGQIDALWRERDGSFMILDFKSDRVRAGSETDARAQAYKLQLLLYREAVRQLWRAERVSGWLYFLRSEQAVQVY